MCFLYVPVYNFKFHWWIWIVWPWLLVAQTSMGNIIVMAVGVQGQAYRPAPHRALNRAPVKGPFEETYQRILFRICSGPGPFLYRYNVFFWWEEQKSCFLDSSTQTLANHLEISWTNQFWIRNVRNWTKSLTSVMSGPTVHWINYETYKVK